MNQKYGDKQETMELPFFPFHIEPFYQLSHFERRFKRRSSCKNNTEAPAVMRKCFHNKPELKRASRNGLKFFKQIFRYFFFALFVYPACPVAPADSAGAALRDIILS